jgi:hypothetical protein
MLVAHLRPAAQVEDEIVGLWLLPDNCGPRCTEFESYNKCFPGSQRRFRKPKNAGQHKVIAANSLIQKSSLAQVFILPGIDIGRATVRQSSSSPATGLIVKWAPPRGLLLTCGERFGSMH